MIELVGAIIVGVIFAVAAWFFAIKEGEPIR